MKHPPKGPPIRPSAGAPSQTQAGRPQARPAATSRPQSIAQRPQFDLAPEAVRAARQHLIETFGNPTRALAFGQPEGAGGLRSVEVGVFGAAPAPHVLATAGASALACADGARREWIWVLKDPPDDALAGRLADVASVGAVLGVVLAMDLKPFTGALVLDARALPEDKRTFRRKDAVDVQVGWIIPVYAQEARFVADKGAEALFAHWQAARPDLSDLKRKPSLPTA
jgi:Suppressor of fused protein (SUFU)